MSTTITARYEGDTHTTITDDAGHSVASSAPKQYGGDENAYGPTDYIGVALASCTLTTMALWGQSQGLDLVGATVRVEKEMGGKRIARLASFVTLPNAIPAELRAPLEAAGLGCFVHESLHPEIEHPVTFEYTL